VAVHEEDESETGIERVTSDMQSIEDEMAILQSSGKKSFNSCEKPPKYNKSKLAKPQTSNL
jgi:hypothetical protein